jgi:hypothetical protein
MKKCIKCGSHAFNLYAEGIDQGGLCDVHYWEGRAHRAEALAQPEQEPMAETFMVSLYNRGYKDGHHDTVEGQYIDILRQDMGTYHSDVVSEWIDENLNTALYTTPPLPVQPVQEPVAWITPDGEGFRIRFSPPTSDVPLGWDALYTTPPKRPWVGLTDDEIEYWIGCNTSKPALVRAISKALKEKNT